MLKIFHFFSEFARNVGTRLVSIVSASRKNMFRLSETKPLPLVIILLVGLWNRGQSCNLLCVYLLQKILLEMVGLIFITVNCIRVDWPESFFCSRVARSSHSRVASIPPPDRKADTSNFISLSM